MSEKKFMKRAIKSAEKGIKKLESPFGAAIVKDGKVIAASHSTVISKKDSTCHAEINAIRKACKKLKTWDLSGCIIYSTTEPCPMCFSACHWARLEKVIYGTNTDDVKKIGFNEFVIHDVTLNRLGNEKKPEIIKDFMRKECELLLEKWKNNPNKKTY